MENPELYRNVAVLPKKDASLFLKDFTSNNSWKQNAIILDIGCGDGSTNKEVLQKFLPDNFKTVVGSDISQKMVDYANENFSDERIKFIQWDISKDVPLPLRNAFDYAFSSYVLHWVKDQRAAFLNIYNTLADGGTCLLMFLGRYSVYEVFRNLSRTQKWADELKDVDMFISPYHDSKNPEKDVVHLMKSVNFKNVEVKVWKNKHTYQNKTFFSELVKSIQPFDNLNKRWDEFMNDYYEVSPDSHTVHYNLIVAYGTK